jgi:hypothetical protein
LDDKVNDAIIVVMQRLHTDDLVGHLLEQDGWTHLNLPAIAETEHQIPIGPALWHRRQPGDVLHPEREPRAVLDESLNPNSDLIVVQQGELLTWLGRPEEGIEWIKRAMRLNPYHPLESSRSGTIHGS